MVMDKLTQFFGTLPELCNVLARYHRASTRTDDAGSSVYAYVSGSAIAPCTIGHYERPTSNLMIRTEGLEPFGEVSTPDPSLASASLRRYNAIFLNQSNSHLSGTGKSPSAAAAAVTSQVGRRPYPGQVLSTGATAP